MIIIELQKSDEVYTPPNTKLLKFSLLHPRYNFMRVTVHHHSFKASIGEPENYLEKYKKKKVLLTDVNCFQGDLL